MEPSEETKDTKRPALPDHFFQQMEEQLDSIINAERQIQENPELFDKVGDPEKIYKEDIRTIDRLFYQYAIVMGDKNFRGYLPHFNSDLIQGGEFL